MKIIDGIAMAARDIGRRKLRSILTIIAIAVGCMLLISMQGIGDTISKTATSFVASFGNLNEVVVLPQKYNPNKSSMDINQQMSAGTTFLPYTPSKQYNPKQEDNSKAITPQVLEEISKIKNIKDISAYNAAKASDIKIEGVKEDGSSPLILGFSDKYKYTQEEKIIAGSDLTGKSDQMLINEDFLKDMGVTDYNSVIGKKITITSQMPSVNGMPSVKPLEITGIIQGVYQEANSYYPGNVITLNSVTDQINAYYSGENISNYKQTYSMTIIDIPNQRVIPQINDIVNKTLGYTTFNLGEIVGMASVFTGFIKVVLDIAAIIVIVVASVGLVNTMTMTVQEKRKWIGIMRAIGAAKKNIRLIFLTQSILLGIIGGIVGCILAGIGIVCVNAYLVSIGKDFSITLTATNIALGFVVSIIVAILAGIAPASRAAKMDVVKTVNEE